MAVTLTSSAAATAATAAIAPRQFQLRTPCLGTRCHVFDKPHVGSSGGGKQIFLVRPRVVNLNRPGPDYTIHHGTDASGPIAAAAYLRPRQRYRIGVAPDLAPSPCPSLPSRPSTLSSWSSVDSMHWHELWLTGDNSQRHQWEFARTGQTFTWKRTRREFADPAWDREARSRIPWVHSKLVDDEERVVAVFTKGRGCRGRGVLQVNVDYGLDFDVMVLMTLCISWEYIRYHPEPHHP